VQHVPPQQVLLPLLDSKNLKISS
jgi:hypothetical protein